MKLIALCLAFTAVAAGARAAVEFRGLDNAERVENEWIVVLDAARVGSQAVHDELAATLKGKSVRVGQKFRAVFANGVSQEALAAQLSAHDDMVSYVEANGRVHALGAACDSQGGEGSAVSWGQARTSSDGPEEVSEYTFDPTWGEGVNSYIIDTGIRVTHQDFEDRATWGTNTIDNDDTDGNGHGTHVASTVGGKVWGIAKATKLIAVKVLSASGGGTFQSVIGGIEYSTAQHESTGGPSTANMSLGGGRSAALNDATDASVAAGVIHVVAGGNSNADSCNFSPAGAETAITVGSTDLGNQDGSQVDIRSFFSNYGTCTNIFAPGSDITGAWINSDSDTRTISGTSMASPHVCGVASQMAGEDNNISPADVLAKLLETSQDNMINMNCNNAACEASPNKLLHLACQ